MNKRDRAMWELLGGFSVSDFVKVSLSNGKEVHGCITPLEDADTPGAVWMDVALDDDNHGNDRIVFLVSDVVSITFDNR